MECYVSLMIDRRAVTVMWFKERAPPTVAHQKDVSRLEDQDHRDAGACFTRAELPKSFKQLDADIARSAIFGMCFLLTDAAASEDAHDRRRHHAPVAGAGVHSACSRPDARLQNHRSRRKFP